ncbi:MAG: biopolymer transporter ExbD [Pseudomonadota bacterium]
MSGLLPPRRRPPADDDARVLPLINVVFLLLVFFMVAGRLEPAPPFRADPPRAASGAPDPAGDAASMRVLIGRDGALGFEGERLDENALLARIAVLGEGATLSETLEIQADAQVDAARVAALMRRLKTAGAGGFRLRVAPSAAAPSP